MCELGHRALEGRWGGSKIKLRATTGTCQVLPGVAIATDADVGHHAFGRVLSPVQVSFSFLRKEFLLPLMRETVKGTNACHARGLHVK